MNRSSFGSKRTTVPQTPSDQQKQGQACTLRPPAEKRILPEGSVTCGKRSNQFDLVKKIKREFVRTTAQMYVITRYHY